MTSSNSPDDNSAPPPAGDPAAAAEPSPLQRRAMNNAILTQIFGALGPVSFQNGLLLLYLTVLDVSSELIVIYIAMPAVTDAVFLLPTAYWADRLGKKLVGVIGSILQVLGFVMIAAAASFSGTALHAMLFAGVVTGSLGISLFGASWFALLIPLVPDAVRGRFFGRQRTSWQLVAIIFAVLVALYLSEDSPSWMFQIVLAIATALMAVRLVFYVQLPELDARDRAVRFHRALADGVRAPGFMPFTAYCFLLMLFTHGALPLFGLVEKRTLALGDNTIVWLGNATMLGMLMGFFLGGKAVDRWGTRVVFVFCHITFALSLLLFLSRGLWSGVHVAVPLAISHVVYGMAFAGSTIAVSTEMLALVLPAYKALSTSACRALQRAGAGLSGLLSAAALKLGLLAETWEIAGQTLSRYDTLLLAGAVMVLLLVVTLGLVPSVLRPHEYVPR